MRSGIRSVSAVLIILGLAASLLVSSCGEKTPDYHTNLLKNGSFEDIGDDGIPNHWRIASFRGLEGQETVRYGVDSGNSFEGDNSFAFRADPSTRRFVVLTQEVEVPAITHIRLRGWVETHEVNRGKDQYAQANYLVTFFDENHRRFQEVRFADKRTRLRAGSNPWMEEDHTFRVPEGTRYIAVSCILGQDGQMWFDNVSLEIPRPMPWEVTVTRNFTFFSLPNHPFPEGSTENQQAIFDYYCQRLGVESDVSVKYYLYPDTASIRQVLSIKGFQYVSWDDRELHTINPNDNHEVVHFITDAYGMPPRSFTEGTVFWLLDDWAGWPVHKVAAFRMASGNLPNLRQLTDYNTFAPMDPGLSFPAAASFIGFIVDRWGVDKLLELYEVANGVNSYGAFDQAFEKVYGGKAADAEEWWRTFLVSVDISDIPGADQLSERRPPPKIAPEKKDDHSGHNH
jgi:hypothetical protein